MADLNWEVDAVRDLDSIAEYIARQSPDYAPLYVERVIRAAERLALFPASGRMIPELRDRSLREVIFQNYRVIYEVTADGVTILGVVHAALDLPRIARRRRWYLT